MGEAANDSWQIKQWPLYYAFKVISQFDASDNTQIYKTVIVQNLHHPMQLHYAVLKIRIHVLREDSVNMATVTCAKILLCWPTKTNPAVQLKTRRRDGVKPHQHKSLWKMLPLSWSQSGDTR